MVLGMAAEGAGRSATEDRGAGLGGKVLGMTAEGAGRSAKKKDEGAKEQDKEAGPIAEAEDGGRSDDLKSPPGRRGMREAKERGGALQRTEERG